MKRHCFALDLVDDEKLIGEYKEHHRNFWPELCEHTRSSGIRVLELYNFGNRLFMLWETDDDFDTENQPDGSESWIAQRSRQWEDLMSMYQRPVPGAAPDQKWVRMEKIYEL